MLKYCPLNGEDCPYFTTKGLCTLDNPDQECDDYIAFEETFDEDFDNAEWSNFPDEKEG